MPDLASDELDVVVVAGPACVGKTTIAAALGVAAADAGRRVVVLTIDPAGSLRSTLGIDGPGEPTRVAAHEPVAGAGELWALALDAEATFDRLIAERSATAEQATSVLDNPVYRAISGSLAGAREYMTIERMQQLATGDEWDLVIVDSPPSPRAVDLTLAPERLVGLLGNPVIKALTVRQRAFARLTNAAASVFLGAVKDLSGPDVVDDALRLFRALGELEGGLRERADAITASLRADSTAFVVVSSALAGSADQSVELIEELRRSAMTLAAVVVNRMSSTPDPSPVAGFPDAGDAATALADQFSWYAERIALAASERAVVAGLVAARGDARLVELPVVEAGAQAGRVDDLDGLRMLARRLVGDG